MVITGASSGFGRAAALAFARERARLVLAARGREPLEDTAARCSRQGVEVLAEPTDVTDAEAVERLADRAVERFGRIDVWVNNAGVILYGRFEDTPPGAFRRVVETTFFGQVHGARAALRQFRRQGEGVLINMGSVWGRVSAPNVGAYAASKHAVRAFSDCLRQELRREPGIEVATMLPQAADTPIFHHAANYCGRAVKPIPPLVSPEAVAEGIVMCARNPKREVTFGRAGRLVQLFHGVAPGLYDRMLPRFFEFFTFARERRPPSSGNLFEPEPPFGQVGGGWGRLARGSGGNRAQGMSQADDQHEALATYLNDHLAGASGGLELARRMADRYRDAELGAFLDKLVNEIAEDRERLKEAMQRLDIPEDNIKQALAWAGEKLSRLKPNEAFLSPSRLSRLVELEAMSLGVQGKLSLWRSLESAGISAGLDLPQLIERATRQREGLERHRREAAAAVLAVDRVAAGPGS